MREITHQLTLLVLMLVEVPLRAGFAARLVVRTGVLEQSPAQRIVGKLHRQPCILEVHQPIKQIPALLSSKLTTKHA